MPASFRPGFIAAAFFSLWSCFCFAPSAAADIIAGRFGVANDPNILTRFTPQQSGDVAPAEILGGAASGLQGANGLYYDAFTNQLWVADFYGQAVHVFHAAASGNATPLRSFTSASLGQPRQLVMTANRTEVAVITSTCCVTSYPASASGPTGALRGIFYGGSVGALSRLDNPSGIAYSASTDELVVGDYVSGQGGELLVFPRTANGNVAPARFIHGAATQLGDYVSGVAFNDATNEIYAAVNDSSGGEGTIGSIVVFPLSAQGNVAPTRRIAGPATGLVSVSGLAFDASTNQLIIASGTSEGQPSLRIFSATANGDVAPLRIISGPNTGLTMSTGGWYGVTAGPPLGMLFESGFESP